MFDTINFTLKRESAHNTDFMAEIPCYLKDVVEHTANGGANVVMTGKLGKLCVSVNDYHVKVGNGSLCKYYMGDNYQTMKRSDIKHAIEKLSDELHVPMSDANVTRLDYGTGFIMKYPVGVYLNHLGALSHFQRLEQPCSLYYKQKNRQLCFYDKNKEQKSKRMCVPELYTGRNVLRYELRYTGRLPHMLKVPEVRAYMLYDSAFYDGLLGTWKCCFDGIQKLITLTTSTIDFSGMTIKKLKEIALQEYIMKHGGQSVWIKQIDDARARGEMGRKQAYDLRHGISSVLSTPCNEDCRSEVIEELNRKVLQATKYYG